MDFTRLVVPQEIEGPREPADISSAVNSLVILSKPVLALLIQLQKPLPAEAPFQFPFICLMKQEGVSSGKDFRKGDTVDL